MIGKEAFSFWLMPEAGTARSLRSEIARFAPLHDGHVFDAHVTVQGDLEMNAASLSGMGREAAGSLEAFTWKIRGLSRSPDYFRSLYLEFENSYGFGPLQDRVAQATGRREGLSPFPHLSIAYGAAEDGKGSETTATLFVETWKGASIRFDRLVIALSAKTVPIENWEVIESFTLR